MRLLRFVFGRLDFDLRGRCASDFEQAAIRTCSIRDRLRLQAVQAIEDDRRLPLFIFGRRPHLVRRKIHGDATAPIAGRTEVQQVPIDSELAATDAEEAAKVDDNGTWLRIPIDDHVDDTTHILVHAAADLLAENPLDMAVQRDSRRRTGDTNRGWRLCPLLRPL